MNSRQLMLSLALFLGWVMSFPFNGPVLGALSPVHENNSVTLSLIFMLSSVSGLVLTALTTRKDDYWQKLMIWAAVLCAAITLALPFTPADLWPPFMAILGLASSQYLLGWSKPYSLSGAKTDRLKLTSLSLTGAFFILLISEVCSSVIPPPVLPFFLVLPLLLSLQVSRQSKHINNRHPSAEPFPTHLILSLFILFFGLYLGRGIMHHVMFPAFSHKVPLSVYIRHIPFILTLLLMYFLGTRLHLRLSLYIAASMLGLSYISFAALAGSITCYVITEILIQPSLALLSLFMFTFLGDTAYIYGSPFKVFGYGLSAGILSTSLGILYSRHFILLHDNYRTIAAIFMATIIFIVLAIIPWLNKRLNTDLEDKLHRVTNNHESDFPVNLLEQLTGNHSFTPRELEIVSLILKGIANKDIAEHLYISENTLKTHLRHIYKKAGVKRKRELLSLVLKKTHQPPSRDYLP